MTVKEEIEKIKDLIQNIEDLNIILEKTEESWNNIINNPIAKKLLKLKEPD